jgi:Ca2+-transporting ATPase
MHYYQLSKTQVFEKLSANEKGLSSEQVAQRLVQYGRNVLQEKQKISPWTIFFLQFKSPLIVILMIATVISMSVGHIVDGFVVMIIVLLNAIF